MSTKKIIIALIITLFSLKGFAQDGLSEIMICECLMKEGVILAYNQTKKDAEQLKGLTIHQINEIAYDYVYDALKSLRADQQINISNCLQKKFNEASNNIRNDKRLTKALVDFNYYFGNEKFANDINEKNYDKLIRFVKGKVNDKWIDSQSVVIVSDPPVTDEQKKLGLKKAKDELLNVINDIEKGNSNYISEYNSALDALSQVRDAMVNLCKGEDCEQAIRSANEIINKGKL